MNTPLLQGKNAVIFGANGSIGAAAAKGFAAEGAQAFLAGRNRAGLEALAGEITARGSEAKTAVVDVLDDGGVNELSTAS
jgi:NADP-dependent 3-hydroxy acid dehydrogenase YdfG